MSDTSATTAATDRAPGSADRAATPSEPAAIAALGALALAGCGGSDEPAQTIWPAELDSRDAARPSRILSAGPAAASAAATPSADALMDWAQRVYPDWFPGTPPTQTYPPYVLRHYASVGNYLGVADGRVYVLGPLTGNQLVDAGALTDFAPLVATDYRTARPGSDEEAARFLLQAQFSATRGEIAQLRSMGYGAWLDAQIRQPRAIKAVDWLTLRGYGAIDNYGYYGTSYQLWFTMAYQLMAAGDACRMRMTAALSNFFFVTLYGVMSLWKAEAVADYWDLLATHAFGNFRDLLGRLPTNWAMGQQLSIIGSAKADPFSGRRPDENFARELMQLYTIGLYELNPDGTEKLDAAGRKIETYTQADVTQLANVFTGYNGANVAVTKVNIAGTDVLVPDRSQAVLPMTCDLRLHSTDDLQVLGLNIGGRLAPEEKIRRVLDHLFAHPNVGPFFCKQLIQRLVTSNPSPGYVARVAAVFADNGQKVRGDLAAVYRAVLLDPEARGPGGLLSDSHGRLRDPMARQAQMARTFGLNSKAGSWKLIDWTQMPFDAPNVFGFFSPFRTLPAQAAGERTLLAPEFDMVDEVSVAHWINAVRNRAFQGHYVNAPDLPALSVNQFDGTWVSTASAGYDLTYRYDDEMPLVGDPLALVRHLNLVLAAGQLSPETCNTIATGLKANFGANVANDSTDVKLQLISWALTAVMASPEYLVQR